MCSSALFLNLSAKWGWIVNATRWQLYHRKPDLLFFVQEGVAPRAVLNKCRKSGPYRILFPACPARSESFL
jgi:hypothetical protein